MTDAELAGYVAAHENEYVQQYVQALLDEKAELTNELEAAGRTGYSRDGRETMRSAGRIVLMVTIILIGYFVGRMSN